MAQLAQARKAVVHALTLLAVLVGMNVLPEKWQGLAVAVLGVASTYGLYKVRNADPAQPQPTDDLSLDLGPVIS